MSPWMVVLAGKVNLYPEYIFPWEWLSAPPWWKSNGICLPLGDWLVHPGNNAILGAHVGLCCCPISCPIRHPALTLARRALTWEIPCCRIHTSPPSLPPQPLWLWVYWTSTGVLGKEADSHPQQVILSTLSLRASSAVGVLWWAFTWDTNVFTICASSKRS